METTKLYVELIIIGLQSSVGVAFTLINIIGLEISKRMIALLDKFLISILLLGVFYMLGLIVDRFSDLLFQKLENKLRNKSGIKSKSVMLLPFRDNQYEFMMYCRSRIRILRATIFNTLFVMASTLWFIFLYTNNNRLGYIVFVLVGGVFIITVCYISLCKLLENIYSKAKVFELEQAENENTGKNASS
jgi:hypothetical protein